MGIPSSKPEGKRKNRATVRVAHPTQSEELIHFGAALISKGKGKRKKFSFVEVQDDGILHRAGIQDKDELVSVNERPVEETDNVESILTRIRKNGTIMLELKRHSQEKQTVYFIIVFNLSCPMDDGEPSIHQYGFFWKTNLSEWQQVAPPIMREISRPGPPMIMGGDTDHHRMREISRSGPPMIMGGDTDHHRMREIGRPGPPRIIGGDRGRHVPRMYAQKILSDSVLPRCYRFLYQDMVHIVFRSANTLRLAADVGSKTVFLALGGAEELTQFHQYFYSPTSDPEGDAETFVAYASVLNPRLCIAPGTTRVGCELRLVDNFDKDHPDPSMIFNKLQTASGSYNMAYSAADTNPAYWETSDSRIQQVRISSTSSEFDINPISKNDRLKY